MITEHSIANRATALVVSENKLVVFQEVCGFVGLASSCC